MAYSIYVVGFSVNLTSMDLSRLLGHGFGCPHVVSSFMCIHTHYSCLDIKTKTYKKDYKKCRETRI